MIDYIREESILFLDIETVPIEHRFKDLDDEWKSLWNKKSAWLQRDELTAEDVYDRAGIYAEFGKIICISAGVIRQIDGIKKFRVKSYFGDDERQILSEFADMLNAHFNDQNFYLCAHNGKEFDFPFIARRMIVNDIRLPELLQMAGKKPWEVTHLDTMQLWKFGDYKHYTSLALLTKLFNLPSPKNDMDGSDVARVYYEENDLPRIVKYCENDVLAVAQLYLKFGNHKLIEPSNVMSSGN